jgi:cytochrome b561
VFSGISRFKIGSVYRRPFNHARKYLPEQIEMRNGLGVSGKLSKAPKDERKRFDQTTVLLHWLTVVLITIQFCSAWLRGAVHHETTLAAAILTIHRTAGMLTWFIGLIRLVWRHSFAYLPPFPESMPRLQQTIAKANEYGLYVLLLLQPITGLCGTLFHGQPFQVLVWNVPALLAPNPEIRVLFVEAHEFGAKALIALIGLHAAAALFHQFVLRDEVLQRMLPTISPSARVRKAKAQLATGDVE